MITKQKTTFKKYRNNKSREQVLHLRPREGMQRVKKELGRITLHSSPGCNSDFVGKSVVVAHWITKFTEL